MRQNQNARRREECAEVRERRVSFAVRIRIGGLRVRRGERRARRVEREAALRAELVAPRGRREPRLGRAVEQTAQYAGLWARCSCEEYELLWRSFMIYYREKFTYYLLEPQHVQVVHRTHAFRV